MLKLGDRLNAWSISCYHGGCLLLFKDNVWKRQNLILFLAALGLSCGTQDLSLQHAGSFVAAHGLLSSCLVALQHVGSYFPDQGSNPRPLHWKVDS